MWHLVCGVNSAFLLFIGLTFPDLPQLNSKSLSPIATVLYLIDLLLAVPSTKPVEPPKIVQSQEWKVERVTTYLNVSRRLCVKGSLLNILIYTLILCFFLRRHEWTSVYPKGAGLPPTALSRVSSPLPPPITVVIPPTWDDFPFPWDIS